MPAHVRRPPVTMVAAEEHADLLVRARDVHGELERLAPAVRRLAWVTPRAGAWERTAAALHADAHALPA